MLGGTTYSAVTSAEYLSPQSIAICDASNEDLDPSTAARIFLIFFDNEIKVWNY
jgi:hypothetical protein